MCIRDRFLVDAAFLDARLVRQVAVLHADDEDVAELEALRRVHRHQPHLVAGIALVGMRQQRERGGQFAGAGGSRAVEPVGQFVQVAAACLELRLVLAQRAQRGEQAGACLLYTSRCV